MYSGRNEVVSAETERELAYRWKREGDRNALSQILAANMYAVFSIARAYAKFGESMSVLIAEGYYGLFQAMLRYDPDRGVRVTTYASPWISKEISGYLCDRRCGGKIKRNDSLLKVINGLNRAKRKLFQAQMPMDNDHLAKELGVSRKYLDKIRPIVEGDLSLSSPLKSTKKDLRLIDCLVHGEKTPEEECTRRELAMVVSACLAQLSEREQKIVTARFFYEGDNKPICREIGETLNLTAQRVQQIEQEAKRKLAIMLKGENWH